MTKSEITLQLGRRTVSRFDPPYVIAEVGVNHEGSIEQAKELIGLAAEGGADAVKFQSYSAETLASKESPAYWDTTLEPTTSQYELFQKYSNFDQEEYVILADCCHSAGVDFLSTPFDDWSVDYLESLVPAYKVASADLTNLPFLRRIAEKSKPVILSTGASNLEEIRLAVETLRLSGSGEIVLLHCILNYPTAVEDGHLRMIRGLVKAFPENLIGYSDHTLPDENMTALLASYLLGAVVIEKHFTHDKGLQGNDHYHAMDVHDLKRFINRLGTVHQLLGFDEEKQPIPSEDISRLNARRSIVVERSVAAGNVVLAEDLTYKRPATGISPVYWDDVVGRKAARDLEPDEILKWEDLLEAGS